MLRREIKRLSTARHPITRCTTYMFWIGPILVMAEIFFGLVSMLRLETIKPSSIPLGTPKTYFLGLSLIPFAWSFAKVCSRSAMTWSVGLDLTTMSST